LRVHLLALLLDGPHGEKKKKKNWIFDFRLSGIKRVQAEFVSPPVHVNFQPLRALCFPLSRYRSRLAARQVTQRLLLAPLATLLVPVKGGFHVQTRAGAPSSATSSFRLACTSAFHDPLVVTHFLCCFCCLAATFGLDGLDYSIICYY